MNIEPVIITDKAKLEVEKIFAKKNIPTEYRLRVDLKGTASACSQPGFILGFDKKTDSDLEYVNNGTTILVDKKKVLYMVGLKLDYQDGDNAQGFFFEKMGK